MPFQQAVRSAGDMLESFHPCVQGIENKRTRELSEDELTKLRDEVDKYTIEGDLRRFNALNIKRLKEIQCYRGRRHIAVGILFSCHLRPFTGNSALCNTFIPSNGLSYVSVHWSIRLMSC